MRNLVLIVSFCALLPTLSYSQLRIKMHNENGVYTTPCIVNGLRLKFIFDTGASNVSISLFEAIFMLKNGYLKETDIKGSSFAQLADGKIVENTKIILDEFEIGGLKLRNIEAVVIPELSAPLLLGQSAIQKLGTIQIEGDELIILNYAPNIADANCLEAQGLFEKAQDYYFKSLYTLSSETYEDAYDLCPKAANGWDLFFMGYSFSRVNNSDKAIQILKEASQGAIDSTLKYLVFTELVSCQP